MRAVGSLRLIVWAAATPAALLAQRVGSDVAGVRMPLANVHAKPSRNLLDVARAGRVVLPRRDSSWWVPLASAVVPGAGQALLGQDRFVAYLAAETFALFNFFNEDAEATRERNRSRAFAHDVARALFPGSRPAGPWAYYEAMEHYVESGVYSRVPGSVVVPEVDETTFNGAMWLLARQTYWRDPSAEPAHATAEYIGAYNFYLTRAYPDDYRWSWRNAQLEQDLFRTSIRHKNEAARAARTQLALVAANHLLATVDAFVTLRLRGRATGGGAAASLVGTLPWAPFGRSRSR